MQSEEEGWDLANLPNRELDRAYTSFISKDTNDLLDMHNKYNLSEYDYECCNRNGLYVWFEILLKKRGRI